MCLSINSFQSGPPTHRERRRWRPYGSPPNSYKSLRLTNLSNLANFGCLSRGRVPRWWKFYQFGCNTPQMKIYHNLFPHHLGWRKLNAVPGKMPQSGSQFNHFFLFIRSTDHLLWGGKPKSEGQHDFIAVSTEKEPSWFHLCLERMWWVEEKVGVPSYECRLLLLGLKRTELLMLSRNMDLTVNWTISIFWSVKTGTGAHLTWRRVISLTLEEKYWRNIFSIFYLKSHQNPMEEF